MKHTLFLLSILCLLCVPARADVIVNNGETIAYTPGSNENAQVNAGGTLKFDQIVAGNTQAVTFTLAGGTVHFIGSTNSGYHDAAHSIGASQPVTMTGSGTLLITGGQQVWMTTNTNTCLVTIALDENSVIEISGTSTRFTDGGGQWQKWTDNRATVNVGAGAFFDLRDGQNVTVGALTGTGTVLQSFANSIARVLTLGAGNASGDFAGTLNNPINTTDATKQILTNIQKVGTGTQTFSGRTTYQGTTLVREGTLSFAFDTAKVGAGTVTVGDASTVTGAVLQLGASAQTLTNLTGTALGTVSGTGAITLHNTADTRFDGTFDVANWTKTGTGILTLGNAAFALDSTVNVAEGGLAIAGSAQKFVGEFVKTGAGTLTVQKGLNATEGIHIQGGTLEYSGTNTGILTSNVSVDAGGRLLFTQSQPRTSLGNPLIITLASDFTDPENPSYGVLEFNPARNSYHDANASIASQRSVTLTGTGKLVKTGAYNEWLTTNEDNTSFVLELDADSWIEVRQGTLTNGGGQRLVSTNNKASVNVFSGATLDLRDGQSMTIGALTGSGRVSQNNANNATRTFTLGAGDASGVFTGLFDNRRNSVDKTCLTNLRKIGTGTQTLDGKINLLGSLTVEGGKLLLGDRATLASADDMSVEATLLGMVKSGAILQLGTGTYNLQGLTVNDGGTLVLTLDNATNGTKLSTQNLAFTKDAVLDIAFGENYVQNGDNQIYLGATNVTWAGAADGSNDWTALLAPELRKLWSATLTPDGVVLSIDGNQIPEPAAWVLMLMAGCCMLLLRRDGCPHPSKG